MVPLTMAVLRSSSSLSTTLILAPVVSRLQQGCTHGFNVARPVYLHQQTRLAIVVNEGRCLLMIDSEARAPSPACRRPTGTVSRRRRRTLLPWMMG
jgi:hypothetical protein